jgi:pyruvate/2-oxoglutarate dehydrogenase complex dihydrolipoamide dehydrogenase (E3) component
MKLRRISSILGYTQLEERAVARQKKRDLIILGGGAGGLVVASVASQLGLRVTLIEARGMLGGDCLHYGCVPSKTLLHCARLVQQQRHAASLGLTTTAEPVVDHAAVNAYIRSVIATLQVHDDPERFRSYGCEVLFGHGRFVGPRQVEVNGEVLRAKRIVIATGSSPFIPPVEGLQGAGYLTNEQLFSLDTLPAHLAILGAGPIGIEMAQAFRRLGSRVTVLLRGNAIMQNDAPEHAAQLKEVLLGEGVEFLNHSELLRAERREAGQLALGLKVAGKEQELLVDELLVATGRKPNIDGLNLEAAGVEAGRRGITVDQRLRTSNRRIYACGDVCGPYQFTHMAEYQAGIVISNALFRFPKKVDYRIVPWVTYTEPELAGVGLSEQKAREQGLEVEVLSFPFKDIDRAVAEGSTVGSTSFVVHKGKIIGASILGPRAGELLHEIVLAMKNGCSLTTLSSTIHAYPTLSQVHRRTANTHFSGKLFSPLSRQLVQWLNRLLP